MPRIDSRHIYAGIDHPGQVPIFDHMAHDQHEDTHDIPQPLNVAECHHRSKVVLKHTNGRTRDELTICIGF